MYTLQPSADTREKQLQLWADIVLKAHAAAKESLMVPATWDLFSNASIDRSLPAEGLAEVMQFLVERGNAEWDNDDRTRARLIFKSVEALASEIYLYAQKQALQGMIVTVYELHSADEHAGSGFFGTDPVLFLRALDALEQEGKCTVFQGESMEENGVKFS